ncbi:MAG TPA: cytochrome P450 [Acidimicrobiales bacterium]|jgi:cytochrome P450|nr:cytochrome P450 [Acidimicrobiales bacterium]
MSAERSAGVDRSSNAAGFDPTAPGFFEDPYPHYERLRSQSPTHVDGRGIVFVFRYDDVRNVLIDPQRTSMDRSGALPPRADGTRRAGPPTFPSAVLNCDPPDHKRLRRLLQPAFTQRSLDALEAWMDGELGRLLDRLERTAASNGGVVDLITGLAFPFPFRVVSQIVGMPPGRDTQIRDWAHAIRLASDPIVPRDQVASAVTAYQEINEYVRREVLPWRRANPGDDLLSRLLHAEGEDGLTTEELLDNVGLLYVAGHETTTGLIGNAVLNLLRHREQLERLRAAPDLLPNAIDELNRFDSPVQFAWRYVTADLDVADATLTRGDMAFVCVGSANRDPSQFGASADRLDIDRANASDLVSFGAGLHYCLGANLARREAGLVVRRLFERFPALDLAGDPVRGRSITFRSLEHLPVSLGS